MINPTKLRHIIAVDRAGSISAAAVNLNITQSSVTKNVAEIEREVGFALFQRHARGVTTTSEGREFIDRASRIMADLDLLVSDAASGKQARDVVLRVGVCPPSIEGLLNRGLKAFVLANPASRVHFVSLTIERAPSILARGDIDLLIAPTYSITSKSEFAVEPLSTLNAHLFGRKDHPLLASNSITRSMLTDYPIITPDVSGTYTDSVRELYSLAGKDPDREIYIIENFPTVAEIVAASDLLATVSQEYAQTSAFESRFGVIPIDLFEPMDLCIAHQAGQPDRRNLKRFVEVIKATPPA